MKHQHEDEYIHQDHIRMVEAAIDVARSSGITPMDAMDLLSSALISTEVTLETEKPLAPLLEKPLAPLLEKPLAPLLDWVLAFALGVTFAIFSTTMWPAMDPLLWMAGSWCLVVVVFIPRALGWWREWRMEEDHE